MKNEAGSKLQTGSKTNRKGYLPDIEQNFSFEEW